MLFGAIFVGREGFELALRRAVLGGERVNPRLRCGVAVARDGELLCETLSVGERKDACECKGGGDGSRNPRCTTFRCRKNRWRTERANLAKDPLLEIARQPARRRCMGELCSRLRELVDVAAQLIVAGELRFEGTPPHSRALRKRRVKPAPGVLRRSFRYLQTFPQGKQAPADSRFDRAERRARLL